MGKYNYDKSALKGLGVGDFLNEVKVREQHIAASPAAEIKSIYNANVLAAKFHPSYLMLKVAEVRKDPNAKTYTLIPDFENGTEKLPFFRAGQYLSVSVEINGAVVSKPYTLACNPKDALGDKDNKYKLTIKESANGFMSKYILENWKVGDSVLSSAPIGDFYYQDLRDAKNVLALAGGSGITPFLSMAYAIRDGIEDFNLTVIFNSRTEDNILFKKELDDICAATDKVKVVHVLSREEKEGYEHGHVTAELIKKYAPEAYSVYICGPENMYKSVLAEAKKLGVADKHIRHEALGVTRTVWEEPGYPAECKDKVFELTVKQGAEERKIPCAANEPILVAIERAGIKAPSQCRAGECGWCRSKLLAGDVFVPADKEYRRWSDKENGYIHPCATFAVSDIVLEVPGEFY